MTSRKHGRQGGPPPAPDPLPLPVADAHTHLYLAAAPDEPPGPDRPAAGEAPAAGDEPAGSYSANVTAAIEAARAVGVDRLVEVGCDVDSSRAAAALAAERPAVLAAVAVHPNDAPELPDLAAALAVIDELAAQPRVRAIGETGLDRFRTGPDGAAAQEESFRAHIEIAKRHGKPLMIHDRDAHADILRVLESAGAPDTVVFHCFSGDADLAKYCADRGWYASFAGNVTFRNATDLRAAAAAVPAELMLVETDAPYLTPMPYRGRPNASYLVPLTVRALAEAKAMPVSELCAALSGNADRVFGGW